MVQQCLDRMGVRASNVNLRRQILAQINAENRMVCAKRNWHWLMKQGTVALTSTTVGADLPDDCRSVVYVALRSTGSVLPFRRFDVEAVWASDNAYRSRGPAESWQQIGRYIFTAPLSNGADTLDIWYYCIAPELTLDADEPIFAADYHQILVEGAMSRLSAQDTFDPSIMQMARANRNELMQAMMHTSHATGPILRNVPNLGMQH